jgi:hypothetical protein
MGRGGLPVEFIQPPHRTRSERQNMKACHFICKYGRDREKWGPRPRRRLFLGRVRLRNANFRPQSRIRHETAGPTAIGSLGRRRRSLLRLNGKISWKTPRSRLIPVIYADL